MFIVKICCIVVLMMSGSCQALELHQNVGVNCGLTDTFHIKEVDVTPWPPQAGMNSRIQMTGVFLKQTYVQEVVVGTCTDGMFWDYDPVDVKKTYPIGQASFSVNYQFPTHHTSYITNIQLTAGDHICCWQFSYNIG